MSDQVGEAAAGAAVGCGGVCGLKWEGVSHLLISIRGRAESLPRGRTLPPFHYSKVVFSGETGYPCSTPPPALQSLLPSRKYKGKARTDVPGGEGK